MTVSRILALVAVLVAFAFMVRCSLDPTRTRLPMGSTDLSSVAGELARLSKQDRALVEAYVKRSGGDFLPPRFADPDAPFTARTFAEAIALEKAWQVKAGQQLAVAAGMADERRQAAERIRAIVAVHVVRRELRPLYEPIGPNPPPPGEATVFTVTVQVDNRSDEQIVALRGLLTASDRAGASALELCQVATDENAPVPAHGSTRIRCAITHRHYTDAERSYVEAEQGRYTESWRPRYLKFASGQVIDAG